MAYTAPGGNAVLNVARGWFSAFTAGGYTFQSLSTFNSALTFVVDGELASSWPADLVIVDRFGRIDRDTVFSSSIYSEQTDRSTFTRTAWGNYTVGEDNAVLIGADADSLVAVGSVLSCLNTTI